MKENEQKNNKLALAILILGIIQVILFLILAIQIWYGDITIFFIFILTTPILCITTMILSTLNIKLKKKEEQEVPLMKSARIIWTFIGILFVISALMLVVFNHPGDSFGDACVVTAGLDCRGFKLDIINNRMSMAFTNNMGKELIINSANITSNRGVVVATCTDNQIINIDGKQITSANPAQPEDVFMLENCTLITENTPLSGKRPGDKVKLDFTFQYKSTEPDDFYRLASGTLTTTAR